MTQPKNTLLVLSLTGLILPLAACDAGGGGGVTTTGDTGVTADATASQDTAAAQDVSAADAVMAQDTAGPNIATDVATDIAADVPSDSAPDVPTDTAADVSVEPAYPEGPYGIYKNDVIADIKFYSPSEKRWVYLHEYYNRPDVKLIILSSAAGWCGPCQQEAQEFGDYYAKDGPYGLEILYALFEDPNGNALVPDDPATNSFVEQWRDAFDVKYPLLIDPKNPDGSFALSSYYEEDAVPMAMTVRTKDMRIRYKAHGYSAAFIEYEILKDVYN